MPNTPLCSAKVRRCTSSHLVTFGGAQSHLKQHCEHAFALAALLAVEAGPAAAGAESGIPTFRGADGFWTIGSENYRPQEMATFEMRAPRTQPMANDCRR